MIEVQGHRGSKGTHKENTLAAFQEGIDAGCVGLELDLRMTKDQEIIIHHDPIKENSSLDKDTPTLQDLFDLVKTQKIELNLEIKWEASLTTSPREFVKRIVDLVEKNGFEKRVAYSSFSDKVLLEVRRCDPLAKIGFLNDKSLEELQRVGTSLHAAVLSPHHTLLTNREDVTKLQKTGARVIPWTVDQIKRLQELIEMGIDGVITNYPRKFIQYLSAMLFFLMLPLFGEEIDVAVIGGGPAGLSAAMYSVRSGLSTVVIKGEEPGGQITLSHLVENYPGFAEGINGADLGAQMQEQATRFGATLMGGKVVKADLSKRPFRLQLDSGKEIQAKSVIIASGSRTKWLGIPSEEALKGRGVNSCAVCDGFLFKGQEVVVVGGGDAALEDALYLANLATKVTVIHRGPKLRASKVLQEEALQNKKIEIVYDTVVEEILDVTKGSVEGVRLKNLATKKVQTLPCRGVFIAIGHIPNTEIVKGQLVLNESGYIVTEPFSTKTKIEGVFAAGDVSNPQYRQAVVAAGFGCMAATDAFHFMQKQGKKK